MLGLVTACRGEVADASDPSDQPPPTAAQPTSACTGVPGCRVVARVDVDGDRKADQVGVASRGLNRTEAPGTVTVRVLTATGRKLATTSRGVWWYGEPSGVWTGAAAIDDRPGSELVLGQTMGAHNLRYRVLTYRAGRLATLRSPLPPAATEQPRDSSTWGVDRSHSFQAGIYRSAERGEVVVTLKFANRRDSGKGHRGWTARYRPSGDGWKRIATSEVSYARDKQAAKVGGWHVKGVRAFD